MRLFGASLITLTLLSSFVFLVVILVLTYLDLIDIQFAIFLTLGINFILWLFGPWLTDFMNRVFYKVSFLKKEEVEQKYPEMANIINQVCQKYNFKFPKIGIIPDKNPTAFSYGSARFNSRIILTEGIFTFLNPQEVQAVVAHELGHIVNRDFIVMMLASTLVQILYEIYAVLIRARGKRSGDAKGIALIAYALYFISTYILLFLSRTRETLADEFSAKTTSAQALANGLIKVAYGIVAAEDDDSTKHLLNSTRHLGIVDVKNAKQIGLVSYITNHDPNVISEVMVFDKINPWARIIELNSTHPLTGNRLDHLSQLSKKNGQPFLFDIEAAITRMQIDHSKMWSDFSFGVLIYFAPVIIPLIVILTLPLALVPAGIAIGLLLQILYKYPFGQAKETTILDEMRNPYSSPIKGRPILLSGQVIGRGMPGYIFSEDMMYQDKTGLTLLDYNSIFGFIGDLFFALKKIKTLFNIPSKAEGWFFRSMGSMVALRFIQTEKEKISSHPIIWSLVIPIILILLSVYFSNLHSHILRSNLFNFFM